LGEHVGVGKTIRFFETFVSEPGNIDAGFVTVEKNKPDLMNGMVSGWPL
jgi:hypothetical protein